MTTHDDGPSWSDIAPWYDELVRAGSGPHETALACLLDLVPEVEGLDLLDLACGQGLATRALAAAGARRVVGVDSSAAMLDLARAHAPGEGASGVSYVEDDAHHLGTIADASVDGVTCQLGLMDIPDLGAALTAVHRVLRSGGWWAFVIGHPCFLAPESRLTTVTTGQGDRPAMAVTGYFAERFWRSSNPQGVRRAGNHHRTLATYLNALVAAGLVLERADEPLPAPRLAAERPVYAEVPIFFAALARKPGVTAAGGSPAVSGG